MNYSVVNKSGVRVIQSHIKLDCDSKIGEFMTDEDYDLLVSEDTDLYAPASFGDIQTEDNIIFKF